MYPKMLWILMALVSQLEAAINSSKQSPLHRILGSLTIHHFGRKASKLVAERISNIFELSEWTLERLVEIPDIGPVVAQNVVDYFANADNISMLKRMESYGVDMSQKEEDQPVKVAEDAPFIGKTILFTGSFQNINRKQAKELAIKAGAKALSAVSSNLKQLLWGLCRS